MSPKTVPRFHSVNEIADALGVSIKTVRRTIAAGDLRAHRIGRQLRISDEDFRAFVAKHRR